MELLWKKTVFDVDWSIYAIVDDIIFWRLTNARMVVDVTVEVDWEEK